VLAEGGTEAGLFHATLDKAQLKAVRDRVPALKHRRLLPES
jgi:predicted amidohydrolase